jgi:hypothetical protein
MQFTKFALPARRAAVAATALAAVLALAACGGSRDKASQTAAKVNKDEITVHQINFVLQQQRNLRPEQADAAARQILERLIDQQLALQKAEERSSTAIRAWCSRWRPRARNHRPRLPRARGEAAPKPTPEEIKSTTTRSRRCSANAASTASRRSPSRPARAGAAELREQLAAAKNINEFVGVPEGQRLPLHRQPGGARRRAAAAEQPGHRFRA